MEKPDRNDQPPVEPANARVGDEGSNLLPSNNNSVKIYVGNAP